MIDLKLTNPSCLEEEVLVKSISPNLFCTSQSPLFFRISPSCPSPEIFALFYDAVQPQPKGPLYFKTSQEDCSGEFTIDHAIEFCRHINTTLRTRSIFGIHFNNQRLEYPISGGTCSAMSFNFAKYYLTQDPLSTIFVKIDNIKIEFETSDERFRIQQAALNTITIDPTFKCPLEVKVRALASGYDFNILHSSNEFYFDDPAVKKNFLNEFEDLEIGIHFVRLIKPPTDDLISIEKQESYGHSMILIKESDQHIFYDPDHGIYDLSKAHKPGKYLFDLLDDMAKLCGYSHGGIFQLSNFE